MTQSQLARRLRCSIAHAVAIESGIEDIELEELIRIARALGAGPAQLLKKILARANKS
jgi:transcriptional regulator with XRE-family HTH domain